MLNCSICGEKMEYFKIVHALLSSHRPLHQLRTRSVIILFILKLEIWANSYFVGIEAAQSCRNTYQSRSQALQ